MSEWIDHDGISMPISGEQIVCIRVRGGEETPEKWLTPANSWNWRWSDPLGSEGMRSGDIVAYRILSDRQQPSPSSGS